jgi:hypothetical protein
VRPPIKSTTYQLKRLRRQSDSGAGLISFPFRVRIGTFFIFLAVLQVRAILGNLDQIIIGERYVR